VVSKADWGLAVEREAVIRPLAEEAKLRFSVWLSGVPHRFRISAAQPVARRNQGSS